MLTCTVLFTFIIEVLNKKNNNNNNNNHECNDSKVSDALYKGVLGNKSDTTGD